MNLGLTRLAHGVAAQCGACGRVVFFHGPPNSAGTLAGWVALRVPHVQGAELEVVIACSDACHGAVNRLAGHSPLYFVVADALAADPAYRELVASLQLLDAHPECATAGVVL